LLLVQFLLLVALLIFSVITKASADPVGLLAGTAAMIAVSAMACQYALLRLAVPGAISTAVMTGNLANAVLSAMDLLTDRHPLLPHDSTPLNRSLGRLFGFLLGCVVAAAAASLAGDWAWSLPAALAAVALLYGSGRRNYATGVHAAAISFTHQFRTRNGVHEPKRTRSKSNENTAKPTKVISILPLITVWLQVRVLPGPPAFARFASFGSASLCREHSAKRAKAVPQGEG
jgi:hypothetical protein